MVARKSLEENDEREKEFEFAVEYADTTAIGRCCWHRVWWPSPGLNRGLGGNGRGDFSDGGNHSPRGRFQGEPEARVRSACRHKTVRQGHTPRRSHAVGRGAGDSGDGNQP